MSKHGYLRVAEHINLVQVEMSTAIANLANRMAVHDQSKYSDSEIDLIVNKEKLDNTLYGTPEYQAELDKIKGAVDVHYRVNSHHPQHFVNGTLGMSLFDLIEMLCDWRAAAKSNGTPIEVSLSESFKRFGIDDSLQKIIINTYIEMKWIDD